jgi:hypothetical protein
LTPKCPLPLKSPEFNGDGVFRFEARISSHFESFEETPTGDQSPRTCCIVSPSNIAGEAVTHDQFRFARHRERAPEILFAAAIGIPTFFVRRQRNRILMGILARTERTLPSLRNPDTPGPQPGVPAALVNPSGGSADMIESWDSRKQSRTGTTP